LATAQIINEEYVTLGDAEKALGKSSRSVYRLVNAGHLRYRENPQSGEREYHAGDLLRIKENGILARRETVTRDSETTPQARRDTVPPLEIVPKTETFLMDLVTHAATAVAGATVSRPVPVTQKLWLTIDEASSYSGRTKAWLERASRAGTIQAELDGGWKIRRESLEAYGGHE
jgi:hypothetical protein